jgi:hypothetical protein
MSFNDREHPRATDGTFTTKTVSAPEVTLAAPERDIATHNRVMRGQYLDLVTDPDARAAHWALGESLAARSDSARTTTDRALLAIHAEDRVHGPAHEVALNPHTPPPVLHELAITTDRAYDWETRIAALQHPNVHPDTFYAALDAHPEYTESRLVLTGVVGNPHSPTDLVDRAWDQRITHSGKHPNLSRAVLDDELQREDRLHHIIDNPQLTETDLRGIAARDRRLDDDDDEDIELTYALYRLALRSDTPQDVVEALATSENEPVRKAAHDRLVGQRMVQESLAKM